MSIRKQNYRTKNAPQNCGAQVTIFPSPLVGEGHGEGSRERKTKGVVLLIVFLFLTVSLSSAKDYYGQPSDYLQYGAGARSLAMGGAYVGLADDASAPYWNPAALALLDDYQLMTMYAPFFEQTQYNFLSAILPMGPRGGIGIADTMLYSTGFDERSNLNEIISSNNSILHNTVVAAYGNRIKDVCYGINLKLLQEKNFGISGSGNGIDLGLMYQPWDLLTVGVVYNNVIRPQLTLVKEKNVYGRILKIGAATHFLQRKFLVTLDGNKAELEDFYYTMGTEYSPWKELSFRMGLNHRSELTYGLGLRINPMTVDYAFSNHELGGLHKFTLTLKWGNVYEASAKPTIKSENKTIVLNGLYNELEFNTDLPNFVVQNWSLDIKDNKGNLVRHLFGELNPPKKIIWDMRDEQGRPIKEGKYRTSFAVNYKNGKEWHESRTIKMSSPSAGKNELVVEMIGQPSPVPVAAEQEPLLPNSEAQTAPENPNPENAGPEQNNENQNNTGQIAPNQ
ncbi:MAG: PorV/PorQ family protein [Elusimicrobiota bacterium]